LFINCLTFIYTVDNVFLIDIVTSDCVINGECVLRGNKIKHDCITTRCNKNGQKVVVNRGNVIQVYYNILSLY